MRKKWNLLSSESRSQTYLDYVDSHKMTNVFEQLVTHAGENASTPKNHVNTIHIELKQSGTKIHTETLFRNEFENSPETYDSTVNIAFKTDNTIATKYKNTR